MVGVVQNAFFYAVFLLLLRLGLAAWQGISLLYPVATILSFAAHRRISFRAYRDKGQFQRYFAANIFVYFLSIGTAGLLEHLGMRAWLAGLMTIGSSACVMFVVLNFWVFGEAKVKARY